VAKSNRRRKLDRVKGDARRAQQVRHRAKAEREQQSADRYRRLLDPATSPADVAEILAAELPDSLAGGVMMKIRLSSGVPGEEIAQTARLMLATATEPPRIGALSVAAWAAHVSGDEDAERGYASELLTRADAAGNPELRLEVIRAISARGHHGEACELVEPYLREHPDDELAGGIYADALAGAHAQAEPGERERAALARYGDRSGSESLRTALDAFMGRTEWAAAVRQWVDEERTRLEAKPWTAAERSQFDALAAEVAITYPVADSESTPLRAFAADPATPGELAARASEWDQHVRFGIWQVPEPEAAPGVWCTELVSGMRRYAQFPVTALDGAAPWPVWLGALVPADGIWRSTGNGIWLSPVEGDAVAEYAEQAVWRMLEELSGVPHGQRPEPGEIRFGLAEPYGVRWETGEEPEPESGESISVVLGRLTTALASQVWRKRLVSVALTNTEGDPMVLFDATVTVSGDVAGRLSARSDFGEEEGGQDGQLVWWGDQVPGPYDEPIVHFHQDGSVHLLEPEKDAERLILGRVTPGRDRVRVQVNSQRRLTRLLRILSDIGAEPEVAERAQTEPSIDFAWGPVPDGAWPAREWEKTWLDQPVAVLDFRSPRHSAASAAEGDTEEALRLEGLLRQLEYQAGLAAARGERPIDTQWLRAELGLTRPLSERLSQAGSSKRGRPSPQATR
jgi:hypothetical protein